MRLGATAARRTRSRWPLFLGFAFARLARGRHRFLPTAIFAALVAGSHGILDADDHRRPGVSPCLAPLDGPLLLALAPDSGSANRSPIFFASPASKWRRGSSSPSSRSSRLMRLQGCGGATREATRPSLADEVDLLLERALLVTRECRRPPLPSSGQRRANSARRDGSGMDAGASCTPFATPCEPAPSSGAVFLSGGRRRGARGPGDRKNKPSQRRGGARLRGTQATGEISAREGA